MQLYPPTFAFVLFDRSSPVSLNTFFVSLLRTLVLASMLGLILIYMIQGL